MLCSELSVRLMNVFAYSSGLFFIITVLCNVPLSDFMLFLLFLVLTLNDTTTRNVCTCHTTFSYM